MNAPKPCETCGRYPSPKSVREVLGISDRRSIMSVTALWIFMLGLVWCLMVPFSDNSPTTNYVWGTFVLATSATIVVAGLVYASYHGRITPIMIKFSFIYITAVACVAPSGLMMLLELNTLSMDAPGWLWLVVIGTGATCGSASIYFGKNWLTEHTSVQTSS